MQFKNKKQQGAVMRKYNSGANGLNSRSDGIHMSNDESKQNLPQWTHKQETNQEGILKRIKEVKTEIEHKDIEWKDKSNTSVVRTKAYKDKVRAKRKLADLGHEYDINFYSSSKYTRKY